MASTDLEFIVRRQQVLNQITAHPELHYQGSWESRKECGTTRCVAGWAVHFAAPEASDLGEAKRQAVADLGIEHEVHSFSGVAARLLGLNGYEAGELFLDAADDEAVDLLRQYAEMDVDQTDIVHLFNYQGVRNG